MEIIAQQFYLKFQIDFQIWQLIDLCLNEEGSSKCGLFKFSIIIIIAVIRGGRGRRRRRVIMHGKRAVALAVMTSYQGGGEIGFMFGIRTGFRFGFGRVFRFSDDTWIGAVEY